MDLLDTKSVVRIWSDTDEPSTVPSSKPQQPSSGSSLRSTNDHHRFRPYSPSSRKLGPSRSVVRQASDNELLYSSSRRGLSAKNLLVDRVNQQLPPRFGANVAKPVKLRRYRTEPVILALKAELKKETGITPNTPERNENPFEPNDLPGKMARPWLDVDPAMFDIPPKSPDSFKWSIDHMSTLHPVEILRTDVLRTEFLKHVQTESDEENAQANIVRYCFAFLYDFLAWDLARPVYLLLTGKRGSGYCHSRSAGGVKGSAWAFLLYTKVRSGFLALEVLVFENE